MIRTPTKFPSLFLPEPRTWLPTGLRNWLGSFLQGPARGPRRQHKQTCIFALGHYGDFVLMLSAVRLLLLEYGAAECTLVVSPNLAALASAELPGVELIQVPYAAGSFLREMMPAWWRERPKFSPTRFERIVCFGHHRTLYTETLLSWVDARQDFCLLPATYPVMQDGWSRELMGHWRLVEQTLGRNVTRGEIVPSLHSVQPGNDGRLLVYPLTYDGSHNVPAERIVTVLALWRQRSRAPIVFGGAPGTRRQLEVYANAARERGISDVSIETPAGIQPFLQHVANAGGLLSADSAPAHIATALDRPSVVLMGPEQWGYCQPWAKSARQRTFLFDTSDAEIAAMLPAL